MADPAVIREQIRDQVIGYLREISPADTFLQQFKNCSSENPDDLLHGGRSNQDSAADGMDGTCHPLNVKRLPNISAPEVFTNPSMAARATVSLPIPLGSSSNTSDGIPSETVHAQSRSGSGTLPAAKPFTMAGNKAMARREISIAEGKQPICYSEFPPAAARHYHSAVNNNLLASSHEGNVVTPSPLSNNNRINPDSAALIPPLQGNGVHSPSPWGSRSFADTVRPAAHHPHSTPIPDSMKPYKYGDFFSIDIDEGIYQQGVADLQECLIGRIMMSQGDKPYSTLELGEKLHKIWLMQGTMELIPLGRGYYTIRFSLLEDRDMIFKRRQWLLNPGAFRLQSWVQNFNPNKVSSSLAQIWIRITDLPMEYWQPSILEAMASAFGTLIRIDDNTLHRRMGHYARILVEIDMKTEFVEKIMYKRARICSFATLAFERLPKFCRNCDIVGHATAVCTRGKPKDREGHNNGERGRRRSTS
ncbi:hypothetical protein ACS0TY_002668 [Phlomoides rotata]